MAGRGAVLPATVLMVAVVGGGAAWWLTREEPVEEISAYAASRDCPAAEQVQFQGRILCPGTRIEVFRHAGIDSVTLNGTSYRIVIGFGRTGIVVGHAPSPVNGTPSVARILWDAQDWALEDGGTVSLPTFEETTHADYLRLAP